MWERKQIWHKIVNENPIKRSLKARIGSLEGILIGLN